MPYSTVLLDFDYTLLDSDASSQAAFRHLMAACGFDDPATHFPVFEEINLVLWRQVEEHVLTPDEVHISRFEQLAPKIESDRPVGVESPPAGDPITMGDKGEKMNKRAKWALVAVFALVLAACSPADDDAADTTEAPTATTEAPVDTTEAPAATTTTEAMAAIGSEEHQDYSQYPEDPSASGNSQETWTSSGPRQ